jgi:hypothetical protein
MAREERPSARARVGREVLGEPVAVRRTERREAGRDRHPLERAALEGRVRGQQLGLGRQPAWSNDQPSHTA